MMKVIMCTVSVFDNYVKVYHCCNVVGKTVLFERMRNALA